MKKITTQKIVKQIIENEYKKIHQETGELKREVRKITEEEYSHVHNKLVISSESGFPCKPENIKQFKYLIYWLCLPEEQREIKEIIYLADALNTTSTTIYNWINHKKTNEIIENYLKTLSVKDKLLIRDKIANNIDNNAAYARLYLERYENWHPQNQYNVPLQINFNFFSKTGEDAQVTEFEEVDE